MTPVWPRPSAHEIVVESVTLNGDDTAAGASYGFGTTTNILTEIEECSPSGNSMLMDDRNSIFAKVWTYLIGDPTTDTFASDNNCTPQTTPLPYNGGGNRLAYWNRNFNVNNQCELVSYETKYSIYKKDDYKRCICDWFGMGYSDCPDTDSILCAWTET